MSAFGLSLGLRNFRRWGAATPTLTAVVLTRTSTAGTSPFTFDETIDATSYAGYRRRLQRASDSGFVTVVQDLYKLILEDEINGTSADWASTAFNPPRNYSTDVIEGLNTSWSGAGYVRERIERDDGTVSAWSNTISDTYNNTVLTSTNGASKNSLVTVSGAPALNGATDNFTGASMMVRATQSATGKKQFEATITHVPAANQGFIFGIDDGSGSFGPSTSTIPGADNNTGITLNITSSGYGYFIAKNSTYNGAGSGATLVALNDVLTCEFDTTAGTVSFYKNGTQIGSTVTGLGTIGANAYAVFGATANEVDWTSNFGASAFTHTLSSGYTAYG